MIKAQYDHETGGTAVWYDGEKELLETELYGTLSIMLEIFTKDEIVEMLEIAEELNYKHPPVADGGKTN